MLRAIRIICAALAAFSVAAESGFGREEAPDTAAAERCLPVLGAGALALEPEKRCPTARGAAPKQPRGYAGLDCALRDDCRPLETHPLFATLPSRARAFFSVDLDFYLVDGAAIGANLPYMLPRQPPLILRSQVHIPREYVAEIEALEAYNKEVAAFVVGHEAAHAYQERTGLLDRLLLVSGLDTVLLMELQADYLGGFFAGVATGPKMKAHDAIIEQIKLLPSGRPRDPEFHGLFGDRFSLSSTGFLNATRYPAVDVDKASNLALDVVCLVGGARLPPGVRMPRMVCDKSLR